MSTFWEKVLEKVINNIWQIIIVGIFLYFVINTNILKNKNHKLEIEQMDKEVEEIQKERDELQEEKRKLVIEKNKYKYERDSLENKLDSIPYIVDNMSSSEVKESVIEWLNNH